MIPMRQPVAALVSAEKNQHRSIVNTAVAWYDGVVRGYKVAHLTYTCIHLNWHVCREVLLSI